MKNKEMKKVVFTERDILNIRTKGSVTHWMACELKDMGAPIRFNKLNIFLKPKDIEIRGEFKDRIKQDSSREFTFEQKLENYGV